MTVHDAFNLAARITGTLPLGQVEYCDACHSGTRLIVHGNYVVAHNPGCTDDPDHQPASTKGSSNMAEANTPSIDLVRSALQTEPRTLTDLVKDLSLGATTVRRALKNLSATQDANGVFRLNGNGAPVSPPTPASATPAPTAVNATAKKTAPAKTAAAKAPAGTRAPRSHDEAQARDAKVLDTLKQHKDGLTREQLAEAAGTAKLTYLSLWRLQRDGKVAKRDGNIWHAV